MRNIRTFEYAGVFVTATKSRSGNIRFEFSESDDSGESVEVSFNQEEWDEMRDLAQDLFEEPDELEFHD
jgi:hypothetical protein